MNKEAMTEALLREFLLGKLDEPEHERIENLFLTDTEARERVLVAEQELIEDYVEKNLPSADSDRFIEVLTKTDEQRQRIEIVKAIKKYASAHAQLTKVAPADSSWNHLRESLPSRRLLVAVAATIIIAVIVAAVWLQIRRTQQSAIERELAQLNAAASLREVPTQMVSVDLSPVTGRGIENQVELKRSLDVRLFELRLPWIQTDHYSTYQAEVRSLGDTQILTIRDLHADNETGYAVRIRIPAHILIRGNYHILLNGIAGDGTLGPAEEYSFSVAD
jgi:hypothetical protein